MGAAEVGVTVFISVFNSVWNIILLLAVAALCGAIAQAVAHHQRGGCLASMGIGFIGAVLGFWFAALLHLPNLFSINVGGVSFPIVYALLGGLLLLLILRLLRI
jgi:uncharacterized membrane protein YeaQ/YmgE (transglycosylase-associated protein family)